MRVLALLLLLSLTAAAPAGDQRRFFLSGFDRLRVQGPFTVSVEPGQPGATASGDSADLLGLSVRVEGTTLVVNNGASGWERHMRDDAGNAVIVVTVPALRSVSATGGAQVHVRELHASTADVALDGTGSMVIDDVRADALNVIHVGMGALRLGGQVGRLRLRGYGGASVDAAGLIAGDAVLLWDSLEPLTVGVRYTAQVNATGKGAVTVLGKPYCKVSGSGPVTCEGAAQRR